MNDPVIEISRRSMSRQEDGFCCGMSDIITVDAEIEARYNGLPVFFHAQWSGGMGEQIFFEATKESVYELWEKCRDANVSFGDVVKECRARGKDIVQPGPELPDGFSSQYDALKEMILDELRAENISPVIYKNFQT